MKLYNSTIALALGIFLGGCSMQDIPEKTAYKCIEACKPNGGKTIMRTWNFLLASGASCRCGNGFRAPLETE